MTTERPKSSAYLWLAIGIALLGYGMWSGLTGGGITAWILAVAGALNVAVSLNQMKKARDE